MPRYHMSLNSSVTRDDYMGAPMKGFGDDNKLRNEIIKIPPGQQFIAAIKPTVQSAKASMGVLSTVKPSKTPGAIIHKAGSTPPAQEYFTNNNIPTTADVENSTYVIPSSPTIVNGHLTWPDNSDREARRMFSHWFDVFYSFVLSITHELELPVWTAWLFIFVLVLFIIDMYLAARVTSIIRKLARD
jgi:hypothetical protein